MPHLKHIPHARLPLHQVLLAFTLLYFIVFGTFMAHTAGQPDQAPHSYYSWRFTETWGIPEEDLTTRYTVTRQPYLYYWLNGAVYKLVNLFVPADQIQATLLWRMMSVVMATFTVFYTYKLAKKVTGNPYGGVLAAFFLSNTLMFVFMSGGISYDNLMYLAGTAAIYHLLRVYKNEDFLRNTALTGIWVMVGALAKEQFLLLTLIIFLAWVFYSARHYKNIKLSFTKSNTLFAIVLIIFLTLFISLYGVNLISYGRATPSCRTFKAEEICNTYAYRFEFYQPFNLQYLWFVRDSVTNPIKYALNYWGYKMAQSVWGILSHNSFAPQLAVSLQAALTLWGMIFLVRIWKPRMSGLTLLLFVLFSYGTYVFFWNYQTEIKFSFRHYGVTGRYLLPTLSTFLSLLTYSFINIPNKIIRRITLTIAILLSFSGGLGMFISRYSTVFTHWRIYF